MLKNRTVLVFYREGVRSTDQVVQYEVTHAPMTDVEAALKVAAEKFCQSSEGRGFLSGIAAFNWGDALIQIPEETLHTHGIYDIQEVGNVIMLNIDEVLVEGEG